MIPVHRHLDAAVLDPAATRTEAVEAIRRCIGLGVLTVCVRPCDILLARELCAGTDTGVCVVLGFPHGTGLAESKADEARRYVALGVQEIDMVANYGFVRSGMWDEVRAEIALVASVCRPARVPLKVIFETSRLTLPEVERLTHVCVEAGADFAKTSTGFNGEGATVDGVRTMVAAAGSRIAVKASGGNRDRATAERFLALGATRLGVGHASCPAICANDGQAAPSTAY
jgi:deoxyribose-phosphate aldolase